jgi:hypothetical protein
VKVSDERWHPLALFLAANKILPKEWITWEPPTVYDEFRRMGLGEITEANACKINAARTLYTSPIAWTDWEAFEKVGHGITGYIPNFGQVEPLSITQCAITISAMSGFKQLPLADEVVGYIASCALHDEVGYLPYPLLAANVKLCPTKYECLDCGHADTLDLQDGRCDHCVGRYKNEKITLDKDVPYNVGRNLSVHPSFSYIEVKKMYESVVRLPPESFDLDLDATSIQVAKLLYMHDKLTEFERTFKEQVNEYKLA